MPSGTACSCYRGPKARLKRCAASTSCCRNFPNILTLTSCCESVRCEQVGRACNEDASCVDSLTRKASLQCDSCHSCARANATARKSSRSPTSTSSPAARPVLLQPLARRGELANIRGWHDGHHKPESEERAVRLTSAVLDGFNSRHEAAGKKSCDLTQIPVSSGDAAPPWRKKTHVEAAGSRRPFSRRSDPAALAAGAKPEGGAIDPRSCATARRAGAPRRSPHASDPSSWPAAGPTAAA